MEFTNSFTANAPLDQVWMVLTNAQEVAPCVPGAEITELIDDHHFKGVVKVRLGAVSMSYRGEMEMQPDEPNHAIVLQGKGTESRGSGGATGKVTVRLESSGGDTTDVTIHSEVDVTGRVATFGRGIMQDVSNRLIKEFANCLQGKLEGGTGSSNVSSSGSSSAAAPADANPPPASATQAESASVVEQPPTDSGAESGRSPTGSAAGTAQSSSSSASSQSSTGSGSATGGSTSAPARSPSPPAQSATEVKLTSLLGAVVRSRLAAGLRTVATWIEPK